MTEQQFETEVLAAPHLVLVDFATHWCGPCRALDPVLRALAAERGAVVKTIDAEASRELATRYDVRAFPTTIAFQNGRIVGRALGAMPKDKLAKHLRL